ncbi:MAG: 4-hydroxythreonine-4-phosphate dehydrogenase PdxA [Cyanobacteria bacterium P01_E01_bin.42]
MKSTPKLAITIGDPAGIGTEVLLKALADPAIAEKCQICLVGTKTLLEDAYRHFQERGESELADPERFPLIEIPCDRPVIEWGKGNKASGAASFAYLETAIDRALAGEFQGIVTAPIAKSLWKAAGYDYPGQTEVLATKAGSDRYGMLFAARSPHSQYSLIVLLATTHIPLHQVPQALTPELLQWKLNLLIDCLKTDFGIENPSIAVSGLNPHSGEAGQLGTEERDWLIPWLEKERCDRPNVQLIGPVPPDTLWVQTGRSWYAGEKSSIDAYLALYHDQGLIPVKLMAFDRAINTTIGLPFIRTSPDHGTAFDIAGKGIADATSMKAAIALAAELATRRGKIKSA